MKQGALLQIYLLSIILLHCFCGCENQSYPQTLISADSLSSVNPDSAIAILTAMKERIAAENKQTQMYYQLICLKAKDKAYITYTSDNSILQILKYYEQKDYKNLWYNGYKVIQMDKKEYIVNQLKRTYHKKYENYCITRIIHRLDNEYIQFITQQLFKRPDGKFALADLYFPQLNISVEIDEPYHLTQKEADKQRTLDIIKADQEIRKKYTGIEDIILDPIEESRIEIREESSIEEINNEIDIVINKIELKISAMGDKFVPWKNVYEPASYYIKKGFIEKNDNAKFKTIDEIGKLFNIEKVSMGYKIHGYVPIVNDSEYFWCPHLKLSDADVIINNAINTISPDGNYVFEYFKKDNDTEVKKVLDDNIKRYVFAQYKDEIGNESKKFIGVYSLDKDKTLKENVRVWKKISNKIELKKYFN